MTEDAVTSPIIYCPNCEEPNCLICHACLGTGCVHVYDRQVMIDDPCEECFGSGKAEEPNGT